MDDNDDQDDPFVALSGFSGLPFNTFSLFNQLHHGNQIDNIDNMDYEQLLHMFPNIPRGARNDTIDQLPVDTYQINDKEEKNNNNKEEKGEINNNHDEKVKEIKREKDNLNQENRTCCICLEAFKNGDQIRRLPCLHIFHKDEIDHWLHKNHVCPICRTPMDEEVRLPE